MLRCVVLSAAVAVASCSKSALIERVDEDEIEAARDAHLAGHDHPLKGAVLLASYEVVQPSPTSEVSASESSAEGPEAASAVKTAAHHSVEQQMFMSSWTFVVGGLMIAGILAAVFMPTAAAVQGAALGLLYIILSAVMIETNRYLMQPGHFPYPFMLTMNHMSMSFLLANVLCNVKPSFFPALEGLKVTPSFLWRFVPIGVPFAASLVCSNWAYKYLSVSFLQIMKQSNIVTIYVFSVLAGLEALRKCNVVLLAAILCGASLGVKGELHFVLVGFILQCISSLCEAGKVIMQSVLMSGQAKLDPLTMVLFMAPACFLANLLPLYFLEGHDMHNIMAAYKEMWPVLLGNACLAFCLNVTVAQCIKQLSAVGYLLCGIVKDTAIIVTSTWLLGESLTLQQQVGFTMALSGVALYSLYKQNIALFHEDSLVDGFRRVYAKLTDRPAAETTRLSKQSA